MPHGSRTRERLRIAVTASFPWLDESGRPEAGRPKFPGGESLLRVRHPDLFDVGLDLGNGRDKRVVDASSAVHVGLEPVIDR